jgi:hypothetical protein
VTDETFALTYCQLFAKISAAYLDYMVVYTRGMFVQGSVGIAIVYEDHVSSYHFHSFSSMYMAELLPSGKFFCLFGINHRDAAFSS